MITISESAKFKIQEMKEYNEEPAEAVLYFGVTGGGCSGLSYNLSFKNEAEEGQNIYDLNGLKVLISNKDVPVIKGTEIDFKESLMGGGFIINNPNAIISCGCGTSFRTEKNTGTPEVCD